MRAQTLHDLPVARPRGFTGAMALASIAAFFGAVFAANGALVYCALSTFSGEQDAHAYERGLAYDQEIAAARAQDDRHWRVSIAAPRSAPEDPATIDVTMRDADDAALEGLAVQATLEFPADKKFDRRVTLREAGSGEYRADLPLRPGQWDLILEASRDGRRLFRSRNRIVLR